MLDDITEVESIEDEKELSVNHLCERNLAKGRTVMLPHTLLQTHVAGKRCGQTGRRDSFQDVGGREELLCYFLCLRRSIRPETMSQPITFSTVT